MKVTHKMISHSKKYVSMSVMLPALWVKGQPKGFSYVDIDVFHDKLIIKPNFEKRPEKK